ncbi:hypothetical protein CYMTET_14684 [Cymbomonas tetramitiformis]|uniref:Uncharacterized protein n=1 Tax=Cymbomonas tetramitiformis TaxID=36881 RepID=A0AAE0GH20_9CHLO|nr:hypothetical protein CYMTET_14684 [Cymbomonas tetramitiformis]
MASRFLRALLSVVMDATSTSVNASLSWKHKELREEADIAARAQAENLRDLDLDGQDERVEDEEEPVELGASEEEGGDDWEDAADRGKIFPTPQSLMKKS